MPTRLALHFRSVRLCKQLSVSQLAKLSGYKNLAKGCNRIHAFEKNGTAHAELLSKLASVLEIDLETVESLIAVDREEFLRRWNKWADEPIRPYIVVRLLAAAYCSHNLPEGITFEAAEFRAAQMARERRKQVALVWTRRLTVWFDDKGEITCRTEAVPGEHNGPTMWIKGCRPFLLAAGTDKDTLGLEPL